MKSLFQDRFLTGILIGIGVLIAAALILFSIRQGQEKYVDDSTPSGALQNYLVAVRTQDYQRAYSYLSDFEGKPNYDAFRQGFLSYPRSRSEDMAVEIGEAIIAEDGQSAVVQVATLHSSRDLFGEFYRYQDTATLVLQNGAWKVVSVPHAYWPVDFPKLPLIMHTPTAIIKPPTTTPPAK